MLKKEGPSTGCTFNPGFSRRNTSLNEAIRREGEDEERGYLKRSAELHREKKDKEGVLRLLNISFIGEVRHQKYK